MLTEKDEAGNRQEEIVSWAYELAKAAHQGRNNRGGHPYIGHPVRVSARFGADAVMQVVGLLHDTVEDTPVTLETIEDVFGAEIRDLVEGLRDRKAIRSTSRGGSCWKRAGSRSRTCWHSAKKRGTCPRSPGRPAPPCLI